MKKYNIGLELLRLLMCYAVVNTHFWDYWEAFPHGGAPWYFRFVNNCIPYAVPVFMLMAFYLSSERFLSADGEWMRKRFRRLVVPFVGWTVITFIVFKALTPLSSEFACTFRDLYLQQLLGTTKALGSQMWFQAVLLILTGFFAAFFRLVKPVWVVWALVITAFVAIGLEYSGVNYWLFKDGIYEVRNPLGRVIPMMSYACVGLLLGRKKSVFADISLGSRWMIVALGLGVTAFLMNFDVFVVPDGFFYRGLKMLAIAVALVAALGMLPTDRVSDRATKALLAISRYSMGIYFVHMFVGRILTVFLFPVLGLKAKCFIGTFIVFAACWIFCVILARVLPRQLKTLVQ